MQCVGGDKRVMPAMCLVHSVAMVKYNPITLIYSEALTSPEGWNL